jgi:ribosomal protein S18 acetylase RimI-like enzyme
MARKHKQAGFRPSIAGIRATEGGNLVSKRPEIAAADNGEEGAGGPVRRAMYGEDWSQLMVVLRESFAAMAGRIDPPSSLERLSVADLAAIARRDEIWVIGQPVVATVTLTRREGSLYVGKLAVSPMARHEGHGRRLIELAMVRAVALCLPEVMLETRVELVENHAFFRHLGFVETARRAHAGFDRATTVEFRKRVSTGAQI